MTNFRALLASLLVGVMLLTGCSASWITTALADLPVLISLAQTIASLVGIVKTDTPPSAQEVAGINQLGAMATAGLQDIQALYQSYKKNPSPTTLAKLQNAIAALQANLPATLAACQIKDPALLARVTAAVNIIATTVNTFASLIPQITTSRAEMKARVVAAALPTPKDLKQAWLDQVGIAVR